MTDILREMPNIDLPASANAPFVYFETVTSCGVLNGVVQVTLEATRLMPAAVGTSPGTTIDRVVVGHLRMSLGAAMALRAAIAAAVALSA